MSAIIDSSMKYEEALRQNPKMVCPANILDAQRIVTVRYVSFDEKHHQGQIVMHKDLVEDIHDLFLFILHLRFPIQSVIPVSNSRFAWDDECSMEANNSSGFNYRKIAGKKELSNHAFGRAFDLNPLLNPYIRSDLTLPRGAVYNPLRPGTITKDSSIVKFLRERGYEWGGDCFPGCVDYQHFQKPQVAL